MTVPTPMELAKLCEIDTMEAAKLLSTQRRQIEQLLVGRCVIRQGDPKRRRLVICDIAIGPSGMVSVYGKRRRDARTKHLIGGLGMVEILP